MPPQPEIIRRRRLPHWDVPDAAYFITTCLEGSIPAQGLLDIQLFQNTVANRPRPPAVNEETWKMANWKRLFLRKDEWLDMKSAVRYLEDARLAHEVVNALYYFAGQRYDLLSFVVMPSHIHWLFQPRAEWVATLEVGAMVRTARERIIHSVNRFTATACNRILGRHGRFWQHESYDHWVRDLEEMERIILYIEGNPVKANLVLAPEDWPFSSAHDRKAGGIEFGVPLTLPRQ